MRVLYSFPHSLDRAGIANVARNQVEALSALGAEVTVYCTSLGSLRFPADVRVVQTLQRFGVRMPHRVVGVQRAYGLHDALVAAHVARHGHEYDVVHAWPRACLRTLRSARDVGLVSFREAPSPHTESAMREAEAAAAAVGISLPKRHSHALNARVLAREEAEYRAANFVLVPSDYAKKTFLTRGFRPEHLMLHGYGCDTDDFRPPVPETRRSGPLSAVFVGRGEPNKGLHVALAAWRRSDPAPGSSFEVCGRLLPDYERLLAEDLAQPSVRQIGFRSDVETVLRRADVLLLPSWTEASALVTLEAQASGCIPLVSEASGSPARHGVEGLVHRVGDVDALTGHLVAIADPEMRAEMRARCVASRPSLSWRASGERLLAAYATGLECCRGRRR